jgi:hypothetical protein
MTSYTGFTVFSISEQTNTNQTTGTLQVSSETNDLFVQGNIEINKNGKFKSDVLIDKSLTVTESITAGSFYVSEGIDVNSLNVRGNAEINKNMKISGTLTVVDNLLYTNPNINGFLRTNSEGLVYSDLIKSEDIQDNAILNSKIIDNAISTNKILDFSITSEKLASDLHFKGFPLVDSVNDSISKNIVNVNYLNNVKASIVGTPPDSLNTLEKLSNAIDNDNKFHEKVARLSGANFTGTVNMTKLSFGTSIKNLIDISTDESVLYNEIISNFNLIGGVYNCYLPNTLENGTSLCVLNNTENDVTIKSNKKMYHYILTPSSGLNEVVITPNMLYCFLFYGNKWSLIH